MRATLRATLLILAIGPPAAALAFSNDQPVMCDGLEATIVGTEGDDLLIGTDEDDVIVALGGNDIVRAQDGDDRICLGPGDDVGQGGWGSDVIRGGGGVDSITGGRDHWPNHIYGGPGDDILEGGRGKDFVFGNGGDDRIRGGGYHDRLRGGPGADTIRGGRGRDRILGGDGNDRLFGGLMPDTLKAGPGDDQLYGGIAYDELTGGLGVDTCNSGPWPWWDLLDCENIVEPPSPPDWYRAGVIGRFPRGSTAWVHETIAIDPDTAFIWGYLWWRPEVYAYDLNGDLVIDVDLSGIGDGSGRTKGITVDGGEAFVVLDVEERIVVLSTSGDVLHEWGGVGEQPGEFQQVCDVGVAGDRVFAVDAGDGGSVQIFDRAGQHLYEFSVDLYEPQHSINAVCEIAIYDEELFLLGTDGLVDVYDLNGQWLRAIAQSASGPPRFLTADGGGKIWLATQDGEVTSMTPAGAIVDEFDLALIKKSDRLTGLVADPSGDAIWVNIEKECCHSGDDVARIYSYTRLACDGKRLTYVGTSYDDTLTTDNRDAVVHMGPGDDVVQAGDGADTICGGPGNDSLLAGAGNDVLLGGAGDDSLDGESGEDECFGGAGTDEAFDCEVLVGIP